MNNQAHTHGLHHITGFAGDAVKNHAFYTKVLGLRLVKKSVNQDSVDVYHLFFADADGNPGTDLTFFPWPSISKAKEGTGLATEVTFAIAPESYDYWKKRLNELDVNNLGSDTRFDEKVLTFEDPDGLKLSLTATENFRDTAVWEKSTVPAEHQLKGFHTVRLQVKNIDPSLVVLTQLMGHREAAKDGDWIRLEAGEGGSGTFVDIIGLPDVAEGRWGAGGIHHVAFRMKDRELEQQLRQKLIYAGLQPSTIIDRFWFESVYFREPGGIVFELATDGPGFGRDEDMDKLGEELILPPWLEKNREEIEKNLPELNFN